MSCHANNPKERYISPGRKFLTAVVTAVVVLSSILVVGLSGNDGMAEAASAQTITYYESYGDESKGVSVTYDGIASTEYNPAYSDVFKSSGWGKLSGTSEATIDGSGGTRTVTNYSFKVTVNLKEGAVINLSEENGWNITGNVSCEAVSIGNGNNKYTSTGTFSDGKITYPIATKSDGTKYTGDQSNSATITISSMNAPIKATGNVLEVPYLFCGWTTDGNDTIYPGDVVDSSVTKLYAKWTTPDIYYTYSQGNTLTPSSGSQTYTNGASPDSPSYTNTYSAMYERSATSTASFSVQYADGRTSPTMFSTLYTVTNSFPSTLKVGTYRSTDPSNPVSVTISRNLLCSGDVVIDSVHLNCSSGGDHGDSGGYSIFANGHRLILGTGLDATAGYQLQVYGGYTSAVTTAVENGKTIVSKDAELNGMKVDIGTYVIVHSGIYDSLVAGGRADIGSSSVPLSTYMVMKGGTVTDTVIGGCGGTNTVYGTSNGTPDNGFKQGGAFLYATGVKMTADYWQEVQLGYSPGSYVGTESSILEGGSSSGTIVGSTHVFLSDDAKLWDAQAGGRRGSTSADYAYMEISGTAVVSHIACGTITDGNNSSSNGNRTCVDGVKIATYDNCKVGMLVGAGYDTWAYPTYRSMLTGTINVEVNGGTVGYVYGGGFRGSIGTPGSPSLLTVNVSIKGGTVLNDVFGGGRGGVDKILNASDGALNGNSSYTSSMGRSYVYGNVNVSVSGGTVNGNVYGGGESVPQLSTAGSITSFKNETDGEGGNDYVATVTGNTTVTITGGTVKGDVFGAGKGVTINNLKITGSTYSGTVPGTVSTGNYTQMFVVRSTGDFKWIDWFSGIGTPTYNNTSANLQKYLEFAKVGGNSSVTVSGGAIEGNVYGGGAYGKVGGNTYVTLTGGTINGNVYGGGVGYSGIAAVGGTRTIGVNGTTIMGSVYGGTAYGNDGVDDLSLSSDVSIYVESGYIRGSILGGGFKGLTYGDVSIYVGYNIINHLPLSAGAGDIYIGESIYLGGDVGELGSGVTPYTQTLVQGNGDLNIYGAYTNITLKGSIMGSGNSCLTKGTTNIFCEYFDNLSDMEAIHRANVVTLVSTTITLGGRSTVDDKTADSLYTLFMIDTLNIQNSTTITLNNPVEDVDSFNSLNKDGSPTTSSSPSNKVVIGSGNSLIIRSVGSSSTTYGTVSGYTILSINNSEGDFGGYALGAVTSTGGFVVMSKGSYVSADFTDLTDCRCWFIAGTISSSLAVTLNYSSGVVSSSADFTLTKLLGETSLRYTGGNFVSSNISEYFMSSDVPSSNGYFRVAIGANTSSTNNLIFNPVQYLNGAYTSASAEGTIEKEGSKDPVLHIDVSGMFSNESQYIGYCTIYLQEVTAITYKNAEGNDETSFILTNSIQLTIEIYTEGTSPLPSDTTVTLGTVNGSGSADIMIPSKLTGYDVYIEGVTTATTTGSIVTVEAMKNHNNTPGWTNMYGAKEIYPNAEVNALIGTLNGGYVARVNFAISDYVSSETEEVYNVTLALYDGSTKMGSFTVTVKIYFIPDVKVTFVDNSQDSSIEYYFPYGSTINEADCPPTLTNFIGWYYDSDFVSVYSYSTPLTSDITLYARYMLVVTFDNQDGTSSQMYIAEAEGGSFVSQPADPVRDGYTFGKWYKEPRCITEWNFVTDKVTESTTLYAGWVGYTVNVTFTYNGAAIAYTAQVTYGGEYGVLDEQYSAEMKQDVTILKAAQMVLEKQLSGEAFIRWQVTINGRVTPVYDDTKVETYTKVGDEYYVELSALTSKVALQVTMNGNSTDLTSEVTAPSTFLVFPTTDEIQTDTVGTYWEFRFILNDATRSGWLLLGWSTSSVVDITDESSYYGSGTTLTLRYYITKDGQKVVDPDTGKTWESLLSDTANPYTVTYYAVWKQIPYTVTIMDAAHGTIDAFYNSVNGTTFTVYYGDRISLRFTPETGYTFAKWIVSGEGTIASAEDANTTFVVVGDCAIYASTIGPQIMQLYVSYNGGKQIGNVPSAALSKDGITSDVDFLTPVWNHDRNCYQYTTIADTGRYYVCLVGDDGTLYTFGDVSIGTTGNSRSISVITVTNNITDADGGVSSYTQFLEAGEDVNVNILAGHNYNVSYAFGSGSAQPLGSSSAKGTDTPLSFNVPSDNTDGITLSGTVSAAVYTITFHLIYDKEYRDNETYSLPYSTIEVRYGTLMSSVIPADSQITNTQGTSFVDNNYAVVAWYLGYNSTTKAYSNALSATRTFDADMINDTGTLDLYSRVIDILSEYQVPVNEKIMNVNGIYEDATSETIVAHAVTDDDSSKSYKDKIYSGTYILGEYSEFNMSISLYDSMGVGTTSSEAYYSLNGNELSFTMPWGYAILITYDRPSISVNFDIGGGSAGELISSAYYEAVIRLPDVVPPEKYLLIGWTVTGGTGTIQTAGTISDPYYTYQVTADDCDGTGLTFTAVYEPQSSYTLTLVTENGTFSNGYSRYSVTVGVGEDIQTYLRNIPSVGEGSPYSFNGWSPATVAVMPDHDLTYTAVWITKTYTLTYSGVKIEESGVMVDRVSLSATSDKDPITSNSELPYNTNVTITIVFDANYTLGSYSSGSVDVGSTPVMGSTNREYTWTFFITDDTDIKITPSWSGLEIHFVVNGKYDESLDIAVQKYGDAYFEGFSRDGYASAGWYLDANCTQEVPKDPETGLYVLTGIVSDRTVYSKPTPNTYYISYKDGSTDCGSQTLTYDTSAALTGFTAPVKDGYVFIGWSHNSVFYTTNDVVLNLTIVNEATVTFEAVWAQVTGVDTTYDGTAHSGKITTSYGTPYYGTINLTSSNYKTNGTVNPIGYTDVGSYTVYYYFVVTSGNSAKTVGYGGSFPVEIAKRSVSFTSADASKTYDGSPLVSHNVTIGGDGLAAGDEVSYDWVGTITDVGTAANEFSVVWTAGKASNYDVTVTYGTLTINSASSSIDVSPTSYSLVYGAADFNLGAKAQGQSTEALRYVSDNTSVATVTSDGTVSIVGAGTAKITITLQSDNVEADPATVSITIDRKPLDVTYDSSYSAGISKVYDATKNVNQTLVFNLVGIESRDISSVSLSVSYAYTAVNASASVPISVVCTLNGDKASNYTVSNLTLPGIITAREMVLQSGSSAKDFDNTALTNSTVGIKSGSFVNGDSFTTLKTTGTITNVGSTTNTISYVLNAVAGNYSITKEEGTLTVNVRYIDVPVSHAVEYTGNAISATNAFDISNYYNVSGSGTDVGTYQATLSLVYKGNTMWNTAPATVDDQAASWSIATSMIKESDFTVDTTSVVYCAQGVTKEITSDLLLNTDYTVTYIDNYHAGKATIKIQGTGGYAGTVTFYFTIEKKAVDVRLKDTFAPYDGNVHYIDYDTDGLLGSDTISIVATNDGQSNTGEYDVTLTGITSQDYKLGNSCIYNAKLTVGKMTLIVVAASAYTSENVATTLSCDSYTVMGYKGDDITQAFTISVSGTQNGVGISGNVVTVIAAGDEARIYDVQVYNGYLAIYKSGYSMVVVTTGS